MVHSFVGKLYENTLFVRNNNQHKTRKGGSQYRVVPAGAEMSKTAPFC